VGKALLAYIPEEELGRRYPHGRLKRYTDQTITDLNDLRADLNRVRKQGYAVDREEHEVGVKCVAAPTFDHKGIAAAVSVSGPTNRMDDHIANDDLINTLMEVAAQISEQMGWGRGVDQLQDVGTPVKGKQTRAARARAVAESARRGA
jgi:DNA-binding IclR family transcriptional regulator